MTRKQALAESIVKVEAGDFDARSYSLMKLPKMSINDFDNIHDSYNGSLDAALSLHEAVLPGWEGSLDRDGEDVWINNPDKGPYPADGTVVRRWLLAILKALRAQETDE